MAKRENISVSLTPQQADFLASCVESGRYQSTSEAVREGVRLLQDQHQHHQAEFDRARRMIAAGAGDLARGRVIEAEAFFAEWDAELDTLETARTS